MPSLPRTQLLTLPQILPSNRSTRLTDLQVLGNQRLHVRLLKMQSIRSCWGRASSSFFSRQEKELSDAHLFISTIVYELARSYPEMRSAVINVFQQDPDIVKKSFTTQFKELIIGPLSKITSRPVIIVVDALDEGDNSEGATDRLLQPVVAHCTEVSSLRLLITSRPEQRIKH